MNLSSARPRLLPPSFLPTFSLLLALASHALAADTPVVSAVSVSRADIFREVAFDAELKPYQEIELHARTSGYLEKINVDAGDVVKEGQLIASLDVPELKKDITRGQAALQRAEALYKEARLHHSRLQNVSQAQNDLVAQHELDISEAKAAAAAAALAEVTSDLEKLGTLDAYTQIKAPFAGVITKRYSDPGALIQAGTSSGSMPLVRLSQTSRLRVTFPVSVSYVGGISIGTEATIRVPILGRTIKATVSRVSQKVESATRTMEAQIDIPNPDGALIAGVYATVVVQVGRKAAALVLPVEAVVRDHGAATVYVINGEKKIEPRQVTTGTESPTRIEITGGVREGDLVLVGSRAQFTAGQVVEPKRVELPAL